METTQLLIIDFCNIKKMNHDEILRLQKKYRVIHTEEGRKRGYEEFCLPELDTKGRFFYLVKDKKAKEFKKQLEAPLDRIVRPHIILPAGNQSKDLWTYLKSSQKKFKTFLNQCSKGSLNLIFIRNILDKLNGINYSVTATSDLWAPNITYSSPMLTSFESYIYIDIANLFLTKKAGHVLPYIKKCTQCKTFYVARKNNPNQKYCSKKCRLDRHNTARIKSGEAAAYKRKRRSQGKDQ